MGKIHIVLFMFLFSLRGNSSGKPGNEWVLESPLGIEREDARFVSDLKSVARSKVKRINEKYFLKTGKCSEVHNYANEQVFTFKKRKGGRLELVIRAYNDGVAFRYCFPDNNPVLHKIMEEKTGFSIPETGSAITVGVFPYGGFAGIIE